MFQGRQRFLFRAASESNDASFAGEPKMQRSFFEEKSVRVKFFQVLSGVCVTSGLFLGCTTGRTSAEVFVRQQRERERLCLPKETLR